MPGTVSPTAVPVIIRNPLLIPGKLSTDYRVRPQYTKLKKHNEAIIDYHKAIELDPKCMSAYANRAINYIKLGKYNEAIFDLSKTIELKPKDVEAYYYNRACCYSLLGNSGNAIQDLSKSINIDSKFRAMAKTDKDFDNIRNTPDFKRLVGE